MDNGAHIIDVRISREFSMGKIKGASKILLDKIKFMIKKIENVKSHLYFVVHQALESVRQLQLQ